AASALVSQRHAAVPGSSVEADSRLHELRRDAAAAGIAEIAYRRTVPVDRGKGAVDGDLVAAGRLGPREQKLERLAFVVEPAVRHVDAGVVEPIGVGSEPSRSPQG